MSYQHYKSIREAKAFSDQLDAERRVSARESLAKLEHWRDWLQHYRAQPRPTNFDWRPSLPAIKPVVTPINPQERPNGKEIEGEFSIVADADAPREAGRLEGPPSRGDQAASAGCGSAPQEPAQGQEGFDTPF